MNKYFERGEWACKCGCGFETVDAELLQVLTDLREAFNEPVTINSACRCESHNAAIGGSAKSKHKLGIAADVVVSNVSPDDVHWYFDNLYPDKYGLGKYNSFTHIDVRRDKGRW